MAANSPESPEGESQNLLETGGTAPAQGQSQGPVPAPAPNQRATKNSLEDQGHNQGLDQAKNQGSTQGSTQGSSQGSSQVSSQVSSQQAKNQGKYSRFVNSTRKTVLAERAFMARSIYSRFKGLLGTSELAAGRGLLLDPCNGIHMFWMTYAIDAVFVDRDYKVVGLVQNIKPWAVSKVYRQARACLELPAGTINVSGTEVGDVLNFEPLTD